MQPECGILTRTGRMLNVFEPIHKDIDILDIATGLSRESRYAGQRDINLTVLQHTIIGLSHIQEEEEANAIPLYEGVSVAELLRAWLLHDATEAYIKDIPSPIKVRLPDYLALEERLSKAIHERYGVPHLYNHPLIKRYDKWVFDNELELIRSYSADDPIFNPESLIAIYILNFEDTFHV
jgi:uncharacterized protein